jgi:hypothetical protein
MLGAAPHCEISRGGVFASAKTVFASSADHLTAAQIQLFAAPAAPQLNFES